MKYIIEFIIAVGLIYVGYCVLCVNISNFSMSSYLYGGLVGCISTNVGDLIHNRW